MINLEQLKQLYNLGSNLSLSDVQIILKSAKPKSYATGEFLITEGQKRKEVFWIRKGLVRGYQLNAKGEETTTMLRWENQPLTSPNLILFDQPAQLYFQALEPTEVFRVDYDNIQSIIESNPNLQIARKNILQKLLKEALQRIDSFVLQSPEERYLEFIKTKPDILNRVPNKYIANVLGITPVSLSRIRKRIASKK
ncbi:MAG: Crp/Fnr family transcriptional regulator [Bacteroidota bacterium]